MEAGVRTRLPLVSVGPGDAFAMVAVKTLTAALSPGTVTGFRTDEAEAFPEPEGLLACTALRHLFHVPLLLIYVITMVLSLRFITIEDSTWL